jgi:hypothetical protein
MSSIHQIILFYPRTKVQNYNKDVLMLEFLINCFKDQGCPQKRSVKPSLTACCSGAGCCCGTAAGELDSWTAGQLGSAAWHLTWPLLGTFGSMLHLPGWLGTSCLLVRGLLQDSQRELASNCWARSCYRTEPEPPGQPTGEAPQLTLLRAEHVPNAWLPHLAADSTRHLLQQRKLHLKLMLSIFSHVVGQMFRVGFGS